MKIFGLIQARCDSKRLPNKVLKLIEGKSTIEHIYERMKSAKIFSQIIILTSKSKKDDRIVQLCKKKKYKFFRGAHENVSSRFYNICKNNNFEFFLRANADSPLLDINIIKNKIIYAKKFDIITNCLKKTYPKGQSIELISKKIFVNSFKKFKKKQHLEHVTKYFYDNKKNYKIFNFKLGRNLNNKYNFCIDTEKDLLRIKKIFKKINKTNIVNINYVKLLRIYEN